MIELPTCCHRREELSPGRYRCTSPFVRVSAGGVAAALCVQCPYADRVQTAAEAEQAEARRKEQEARQEAEDQAGLTEEQSRSFLAWLGDTASMGKRMIQAYRKWFAAGRPRPTPEQLAERKAACEACPHLRGRDGGEKQCGLCGCPIGAVTFLFGLASRPGKAEMSTETCPDSTPRWKPLL